MRLKNFFVAAGSAAAVGLVLAGCGPRDVSGMCKVKPGTFHMGYAGERAKPDEKPVHDVDLNNWFYIDEHEVTNQQYLLFLKESHRAAPAAWKGDKFPDGAGQLPVTGVTYEDAKTYAGWAKKRLPTAEEWEYAARGPESRLYPWGNDWVVGKCNSFDAGKGGAVKVEEFQGGKSWCGTFDQSGNVWEWTSTPAPGTANVMIIKGGSYAAAEDLPRASLTARLARDQGKENVGFRCVKDVE